MNFLYGLGFFVGGLFIVFAIRMSKRSVNLGCRASIMVVFCIIAGAYLMLSETWRWAKFFFSWDNLTNWGPAPIYQITTSRIPTSTFRPASILHPTQLISYRPVTWMELVSFLSDDHTNWNAYDSNYYVCLDFSIDLVESAGKQNIKGWIVGVDFYNQENGHAFVAFETTDLGVVYIEPQSDFRYIIPIVGKPLCDASTGTYCIGTISKIEYLQCDHSLNCTLFYPY